LNEDCNHRTLIPRVRRRVHATAGRLVPRGAIRADSSPFW
jgi:hypothetical protein